MGDTLDCAREARSKLAVFGKDGQRRFFFPVLHITEQDHTIEHSVAQAQIAFENGADGVMLCAWPASPTHIVNSATAIRKVFPRRFIGANFMADGDMLKDISPNCCDALWYDVGVDGNGVNPRAERMQQAMKDAGFSGLHFGSYAFKGQKHIPTEDLPNKGPLAAGMFDVPTTSGGGTGVAMDPERTEAVRSSVGSEAVLAIASGVSTENVKDYLPYIDCYIVGTSIEKDRPSPLASGEQAAVAWAEIQSVVATSLLAEPSEADVLAIVNAEKEKRLCTDESLGKQTGLSEGLISVWLEGNMPGRKDIVAKMWARLVRRHDTARAELDLIDLADHQAASLSGVGGAGTALQGELEASKVASLASAIHSFDV